MIQVTQETWVQSLGWKDPLEEQMAIQYIFLPREAHGQRNLGRLRSTGSHDSWACTHNLNKISGNKGRLNKGYKYVGQFICNRR